VFVTANRGRRTQGLRWGLEPICRVLQVSPAAVRSAMVRPVCARRVADEVLKVRVQEIFDENYQVYGCRKIRAVLAREDVCVDKDRLSRLMGELNIRGATRSRRRFTTRPDPAHARAPDRVHRQFTADAPNRLWVSDFTYCSTWTGVVYVAFVIDVFSRMIVGWHLDTTMRTDLVMTALEQAIWRRDTLLAGLVAHSDAGSQYTSIRYTDRLAEIGALPSIGTVGDSYDNAMAESTIGLYKSELVWPKGPWRTVEQLELATLTYVEWFNHRRLHGELGLITPSEAEQHHYNQPRPETPVTTNNRT
jgi:putative transposase